MKFTGANSVGVPYYFRNGNAKGGGRVYGIEKMLLRRFLQSIGDPPMRVTLWDGKTIIEYSPGSPVGMVIRDRLALWRLLINPFLYFGDDYCMGRIEIEPGLPAFLETVYRAIARRRKFPRILRSDAYRLNQPNSNSLSGSRSNIHHHYDIGNNFYELWLDEEMVYTCAYFPVPSATLEEAQIAKMDLVSRKLRLKEGQNVVEAGCGWGSLALYMASRYGVRVKAFNISGEQISYARDRAKAAGLAGQVEYIQDDYRNISGSYDAFVSVGMLEHVGPNNYRELGRVVDRCLSNNGLGLIHTIGQNMAEPMGPWLLKRIFPGSYPPTIREMMEIFEPWGFTVLDIENLRLHYAKTLEHWLERFEHKKDTIKDMFDDSFVRAWRLYLSGSIANFRVGELQLFQVLFSHSTNNLVPWTRSHLIEPSGES